MSSCRGETTRYELGPVEDRRPTYPGFLPTSDSPDSQTARSNWEDPRLALSPPGRDSSRSAIRPNGSITAWADRWYRRTTVRLRHCFRHVDRQPKRRCEPPSRAPLPGTGVIALAIAYGLAIVALWAFAPGRYMLAGMSFLFVSFSLSPRETRT